MLTIGSLFSGIGGLELGLERAGLGPVYWQVGIDPKARAVLAHHWPEVTRHEDVRTVGAATLAPVDLICGGFPCEDTSSAGKGAGLDGARSGLWFEFRRIVSELLPQWVVVENVTSGANRWVDAVVEGLEQLGYACLPVPLAASDVGAPHRRARVFIVAAHADGRGQHAVAEHAEVASASAAADALGGGVRLEQGRSSGESRAGETIAANNGAQRALADALFQRRERTAGQLHAVEPDTVGWWSSQPEVGALVHGLSGGLAGRSRRTQIRVLGKAVVPQCAEVVGHVIQLLSGVTDGVTNRSNAEGE